MTVGTTVYLRATDANDNSEQAVGVQRENFYGAVAGDLYRRSRSNASGLDPEGEGRKIR